MPEEEIPTGDETGSRKQAGSGVRREEIAKTMELAQAGRFAEAKRRLVQIRETGTAQQAAAASYYIGHLWLELERPELAITPLREAAMSTNLAIIGDASTSLGDVYTASDQVDLALHAYKRGVFAGNGDRMSYSALCAGELLAAEGHESAISYFEHAIAGPDVEVADAARERLLQLGATLDG